MLRCPNCNEENVENSKFCSSCGAPLLQRAEKSEEHAMENSTFSGEAETVAGNASQSRNESTVRKMFRFSSSREKFLASIGNSFIENFLTGGKVSQTIAALTDKRLYYHGHTLTGNGLKLSKMTEEGSVMVRDITYTGFSHSDPKWMKIVGIVLSAIGGYFAVASLGILLTESAQNFFNAIMLFLTFFLFSACLWGPGVLLLRKYKQERKSVFIIRFAGGGLAFDINVYPVEESRNFQDALNRAVDAEK